MAGMVVPGRVRLSTTSMVESTLPRAEALGWLAPTRGRGVDEGKPLRTGVAPTFMTFELSVLALDREMTDRAETTTTRTISTAPIRAACLRVEFAPGRPARRSFGIVRSTMGC